MDGLPFFQLDNDDLLYEFQDLSDVDMLPTLENIKSFININEIDSLNTAEILLIEDESRQFSCKYYAMQDFKRCFYKSKGLHIVHYNVRSLNSNMTKIVENHRQVSLTFLLYRRHGRKKIVFIMKFLDILYFI